MTTAAQESPVADHLADAPAAPAETPAPDKLESLLEAWSSTNQAMDGLKRLVRVINENRGAAAMVALVAAVAVGTAVVAIRAARSDD